MKRFRFSSGGRKGLSIFVNTVTQVYLCRGQVRRSFKNGRNYRGCEAGFADDAAARGADATGAEAGAAAVPEAAAGSFAASS